jgi:hypothetical protein
MAPSLNVNLSATTMEQVAASVLFSSRRKETLRKQLSRQTVWNSKEKSSKFLLMKRKVTIRRKPK